MNKDDILNLAGNPDFIPGIYNYCDRWCERCAFTSRCMVFAMEEQQFDDPAARDLHNEAFWQALGDTLQMTMEMIHDMAEERGIDLDAVDVEAEMEEQRRIEEAARSHPCAVASTAYADMVNAWFESAEDFPKDSDGSAKVALIAMDRSIAAWGELHRHFPAAQDDILDILVHLDRLRRQTEQEFPDARAFVRPGFDEDV